MLGHLGKTRLRARNKAQWRGRDHKRISTPRSEEKSNEENMITRGKKLIETSGSIFCWRTSMLSMGDAEARKTEFVEKTTKRA